MSDAAQGLRFLDILTTSSAVSNYLGVAETTAGHLLSAIAILRGETTIDELGRPTSPLLRSARGNPGVAPGVRDLVQHWFDRLGASADAELGDEQLVQFVAELRELDAEARGS